MVSICPAPRRRQIGIGIIELMVSILVISVGLLGIAAAQLDTARAVYGDKLRYRAERIAANAADMLRSNREAVSSGAFTNVSSRAVSDPGYDCIATYPGGGTICDPVQRAAADLWRLKQTTSDVLPGGAFSFLCTDDNDPGYVDANTDGINDADTDGAPCSTGSRIRFTVSWRETLETREAKALNVSNLVRSFKVDVRP